MKKIFTLSLLFAGISMAVAQTTVLTPPSQTTFRKPAKTVPFDITKTKVYQSWITPAATESFWLNYGVTMDNFLGGGISELNANYLFPDSTVLGEFGTGTYDYVWIHNIGNVLDVKSDNYAAIDGVNWNTMNSYSVDSMAIVYIYERNIPNPNIVDTLIVYLLHNGTAANLSNSGFIGTTAANYNTDTVTFKTMVYDYNNNRPTASGMTTIKIPLTAADTSTFFFGEKAFAINPVFNVPAGRLVAASVVFKPGYAYATGDTLETALNNFLFASYEEGGASTYPLYTDCNYQSPACDYNVSSIVRTNERYNVTGNSWNGRFIPTYAFTQPYSLEHHLISWKVTSGNVGIAEAPENGITLGQNQPNPANGNTVISYSINEQSNVELKVYDMTGKLVMNVNEGKKSAGKHAVTINTNTLPNGIYYYSITVGGKTLTRKMVVID
jgi:hypothetical protein